LALVDITDGEARDSIAISHSVVGIQECERSITALLSVHANHAKANTLVQVVVESDTFGKIGAGVESARPLVVIDCGAGEGVFENPIGARLRPFKTSNGTVAGRIYAILGEKVDHSHHTGDINSLEITVAY
jgi:hypothetical protein